MGGSNSVTYEQIFELINQTDEKKQIKLSKKIFKALDKDGSGTLDKSEMMTLVTEFFRMDPKGGYMLHNYTQAGKSESEIWD